MTRDDLKKKRIGVLMGGLSSERDVSLRTGEAILNALRDQGYSALKIDAGRDLSLRLAEEQVEVAFIALHGRYGEDGTVQGLLEMEGIPYTGSGVLASSLAMDKVATKKMLIYHELPTPGFRIFRRGEDIQALIREINRFPVVVKPSREGSTIGVTIAGDAKQLKEGILEAQKYDEHVLVEEFVEGDEVTVSVIDREALPVIQVVPIGGFYDYRAKYTAGRTEYLLPAPLEGVLYARLQKAAVDACEALDCRGAARVDFMVKKKEFFCLEVNTIPGMTETSLLPKAAAHIGIPFAELVQRMLEGAGTNK